MLRQVFNWQLVLLMSFMLGACATSAPPLNGRTVPSQKDSSSMTQLGKTDINRLADVQMRENIRSLRLLMSKLYKRNPRELKKSTTDSVDKMVAWVFEGDHGWRFAKIHERKGVEAIHLAFSPEYQGDRVLPYIVGLYTMMLKAHGGRSEFFLMDSIDPQHVYNAARNVEIATWKLSQARDASGALYLLTNDMGHETQNLSFEREVGKIVGRLDVFAMVLAERSERLITLVVQNLATAMFLPF